METLTSETLKCEKKKHVGEVQGIFRAVKLFWDPVMMGP
jgi:hypothetical protein